MNLIIGIFSITDKYERGKTFIIFSDRNSEFSLLIFFLTRAIYRYIQLINRCATSRIRIYWYSSIRLDCAVEAGAIIRFLLFIAVIYHVQLQRSLSFELSNASLIEFMPLKRSAIWISAQSNFSPITRVSMIRSRGMRARTRHLPFSMTT